MAEIALCSYHCPNCNAELTQEGYVIIEVQDEGPRQQLMDGDVNIVSCDQCGNSTRLNIPLLYHDNQHELLIIYVPELANLVPEQLTELIREPYGILVTKEAERRGIELPEPDDASFPRGEEEEYKKRPGASFHALTQEQAAALLPLYLLRPTIVDTFDVLRTAAQAAYDGMTGQEVADDMARLQLINQIISESDPINRRKIMHHNEPYLNEELYEVIDTLCEQMTAEGKPELVEQLKQVRRHVERYKEAQKQRLARNKK
ncbi:MAG TPA: CpXC domain-containing protein [Chloroflexia bacterium]|nr:CpXC domain-containing protein [Chloroflexia bacterium]